MSDDYRRIELITGTARRRHWSTEQKLQIIEESFQPGETVSSVARRRGVAPNLLYRWRRLMSEGGAAAVGSDEPVVGSSEVRRLEERIRDLERLLGRKTMESRDPPGGSGEVGVKKTELAALVAAEGRFPMKAVADALEVARSHLHEKVRRLHAKARVARIGAQTDSRSPAGTVTWYAWPSSSMLTTARSLLGMRSPTPASAAAWFAT